LKIRELLKKIQGKRYPLLCKNSASVPLSREGGRPDFRRDPGPADKGGKKRKLINSHLKSHKAISTNLKENKEGKGGLCISLQGE